VDKRHWAGALLAGIIVLLSLMPVIRLSNGEKNLYVLQADAFLHGRLAIDRMAHDVSVRNGHYYVAFPPIPAIILTPLVAVFGSKATNPHLVALVLSLLSLVLLRGVLVRLELDARSQFWLILAFLLGTGNFLALKMAGGVWFLAHEFATLFLLLAIVEALGKARGWLVGFGLGGAFLSRQLALFNLIFLTTLLWKTSDPLRKHRRITNLLGLAISLGGCVGFYLLLNFLRFGSPFDSGYQYMPQSGLVGLRAERYGLFSGAYVPFNLIYLLFQGFHVSFNSPDFLTNMVPDAFGTSIFGASPFVLLAFFASRKRAGVISIWLTVIVIQGIQLFYFGNGWMQYNTQRYALDYWPALMVLIALGFKEQQKVGQQRLWHWLIVFAVIQNLFMVGFLPELNRFLKRWASIF
jgi:hypothetical protein